MTVTPAPFRTRTRRIGQQIAATLSLATRLHHGIAPNARRGMDARCRDTCVLSPGLRRETPERRDLRRDPGAYRHQGIIDLPPRLAYSPVSATVAKGPAWRTTSTPSSICFRDWCGLRSRMGSVDFFNRHWCAYTGLDVDEAYGSGWQLAIHPADRPACSTAGNPCWRPVSPAGMEARLRRFDGEYRWFQFCTTPLRRRIRADRQVVRNRHRRR